MKSSVVEKIAEWLEENGLHRRINGNIDTDGYTVHSETELGSCFTNYNGKRYNFRINAEDKSKASDVVAIYGNGVKLL